MPYFESPPTWLLGLVVAVIIGTIVLGSKLYTTLASAGQRSPSSGRPRRSYQRSARSTRSTRSRHMEAVQPVQPVQPVQTPESPAGDLPTSALELKQLVRAATMVAQGDSEQVAIELSFSVKKGGGAGWRRAKQLLDSVNK